MSLRALRSCVFGVLGSLAFASAAPLVAQQRPALPPSAAQAAERLREEQAELERLRGERQQLEARMRNLQSSARDVAAERQNLERQAVATARVVRSLDQQLGSLMGEVQGVNSSLARTQDELAIKRAILRRRVNEIYKRGPLYALEALLSAESFGALVARYKYLSLVARRDRAMLARLESLSGQITAQRFLLVRLQNDMEANRRQKAEEESRLRRLELARGRTLADLEAQARRAQDRITQLVRDEQRMAGVIAALEDARRRAEAAAARSGAAPTASSLSAANAGRLDWPVDGELVYRFGRVVSANNTSVQRAGIGIGAPLGTAVKAVADGTVGFAEPYGTYGNTVIIEHGGGDYSIYASLQEIRVTRGARITKGQVIGTVGQADPDNPPLLHFEIRPRGRQSVDPLEWLRQQRP